MSNEGDEVRQLLTISQIAKLCQIGPDKVLASITTKQLPAMNLTEKVGKQARWRIDPADLEAFLNRRKTQPPQAPARREKRLVIPLIVKAWS